MSRIGTCRWWTFSWGALIKPNREGRPRIVILYDPSIGITFLNPLDKQLVARKIGEDRLAALLSAVRKDIVTACAALRELVRTNIMVYAEGDSGRRIRKDFAIIIRYGEVVAPASRGDVMLDSDRLKVITLENWFSDSTFVISSDIVFIIAETLSGLNERIVDLPYCSAIKIDRPTVEERQQYVEYLMQKEHAETTLSAEHMAYSSAGLTLLSLRQIFRQAAFKGDPITPELIFDKTKEIIEKELEGHIEFPFPHLRIREDYRSVPSAQETARAQGLPAGRRPGTHARGYLGTGSQWSRENLYLQGVRKGMRLGCRGAEEYPRPVRWANREELGTDQVSAGVHGQRHGPVRRG